jgi:hypothetical protein
LVQRADVTGLIVAARRVLGVRLMRRTDDSIEQRLYGDIVVDALGRTSRLPDWMDGAGLATPEDEQINCDARYTTSYFSQHNGDLDGILAVVHAPTPAHPHGAVLARIEDQRWILTLSGMAGATPPVDPAGFVAYANSLDSPEIADIAARPPLERPCSYRFVSGRRRRFENLAHPPHGVIAIGDSIATFNPVYGQGMSIAAIEAVALEQLAQRGTIDPAQWFRTTARIVNPAWEMATVADTTFATTNRPPLRYRIANRYIAAIHDVAEHDAAVAEAFVRVAGLVDPPATLMRPRHFARVARHAIRRRPPERSPSTGHSGSSDDRLIETRS